MSKLKLFIIIFSIIGISYSCKKQPNTVFVKLRKHQYGWCYVVITSYQKPTKIGEYYIFNSDGVCIIDKRSLNDSTKMKVIDDKGNDATFRCKRLMKSIDEYKTIKYSFYCVDSNQTNWDDFTIDSIEANRDSALNNIKRKEYLKNKGYFN